MIQFDNYHGRIYNLSTPKPYFVLVRQHSITNSDEVKDLEFDLGNSLLQPRGKGEFYINEDDMISLIAPSCTFTSITRDHVSHALYVHNRPAAQLAQMYFLLLLVIITNKNNPFFSKHTLDIVIPQLSQLAQLANKQEGNFLEGLYLKELLVAYFSHKISPEAYYIWPNKENLNSAINDYFESFYLNNINKIGMSLVEIYFDRTYYLPSKRSNLVFLPQEIFNYKEGSVDSVCKAICLPIIFDTENSWRDSISYKLLENYDLAIEKGKQWNVMSLENYKGDTKLYPISRDILNILESKINFNYKKSELEFKPIKEYKDFFDIEDENKVAIPGLHYQTCEEIMYYSSLLQQFYISPDAEQERVFYDLLRNPEKIKNYSGYKELDDLFVKEEALLGTLRAIREEAVEKKDSFNLSYFVDNFLSNITNGFRGKQVAMDIKVVEKFPGIEHYDNLFNSIKSC